MHRDPISSWLTHLHVRNLAPGTIYHHQRALIRLQRHLDGPVLAADRPAVHAWYLGLILTPEARANELATVRGFYRWALSEGLLDADPTAGLFLPKVPRRLPRPIDDVDLAVALDAADDRLAAVLELGAFCGLRACEVARLRWDDVRGRPVPLLAVSGKGGHPRLVPAPDRVLAALERLPGHGPVIRRGDGLPGPNAAWRISQVANRHLHGLGIRSTFHALRHRFATVAYDECRDLRVVQELLGHASPHTTAVYAAHSPGRAVEAVRAAARLRIPGLEEAA